MEIDTTIKTNKDFPFYWTYYVNGQVKGCAKNADISCNECLLKSMCLCIGDK